MKLRTSALIVCVAVMAGVGCGGVEPEAETETLVVATPGTGPYPPLKEVKIVPVLDPNNPCALDPAPDPTKGYETKRGEKWRFINASGRTVVLKTSDTNEPAPGVIAHVFWKDQLHEDLGSAINEPILDGDNLPLTIAKRADGTYDEWKFIDCDPNVGGEDDFKKATFVIVGTVNPLDVPTPTPEP